MSPKNSIASAFFLSRQILKNIVMPQQKPQYLLTAEANSECCNIWVEESCSAVETYRLFIWALTKD